jgi:hypothetical protein
MIPGRMGAREDTTRLKMMTLTYRGKSMSLTLTRKNTHSSLIIKVRSRSSSVCPNSATEAAEINSDEYSRHRPSRSDEQIPRRTFSWTTDPSEPEANGVWLTFWYNGERIEVSRDGEAYKLSRDGKAYNLSGPVVLSVNGKPVELESDGETIKLPDGRPLKFSIN